MAAAGPAGHVIDGLRAALSAAAPALSRVPLVPLADTGLAHWHIRLVGTALLARIPKQSQMQLSATDNLAYQRACFERAAPSHHTPRLHHVLPPSAGVPRGALIVDEIVGRPAQLPGDLRSIVEGLAALHRCTIPDRAHRAPLRDADDPLADLLDEIRQQGTHLDAAGLQPSVRHAIGQEIETLADTAMAAPRPPKALIAFDAHPGNFLIRADGGAVLVDLEKARYAYPPLDLAHATLYTSTTWDVASSAVLTPAETAGAYADWAAAMGPSAAAWGNWYGPLRRAMWLWSVTWCSKWRVLNGWAATTDGDGEDWSAGKSDPALVAHVRSRVDHYLSPEIVGRMRDEFTVLDRLFLGIRDNPNFSSRSLT